MKTILVSVLCAAAVSAADLPADWKNVQQLDIAQPGLVKISLPASTLDAARPALEDLRIFNSTGREVPFMIQRPVGAIARARLPERLDVKLDGRTTVIFVETGLTQPLEAVTLDTPAGQFIKAVTVEGSNDQQAWQLLVTGQPIFRQQNGASQLRVRFPKGVWAFLRVTIDDRRSEAIPFTTARVHPVAAEPSPTEPVGATLVDRTENDGQTRLTLDLGASHLTVAALQFETSDPLFTRAVSVAVRQVSENAITERVLAQDTIFRVAVEGFEQADRLEIPLDQKLDGRELLVLIDNGDNSPLDISAVRVTRRPVYAVFLAQSAGEYKLVTGNSRAAAPRYDLAALSARLQGAAVSDMKLSALVENPTYHPSEALPEIQDLGTALDTAAWSHRKRVEIKRPGVQQLDLDLEVLSRADASFRDLRLVREDKQRPYILERTSIQRKLVPQVSSVPDPKRPQVSRWEIKLPQRNLALTRLTCTTRTALFRRQVRLYEQPENDRGEKYERYLGQATWVRTPPANNAPLELTIGQPAMTDTLVLETDNGDNPPVELENFQLFHPVTRVLFKAPAEPATYLYYGNNAANFPQYDLDLIAPRLLAEEKTAASLAAGEPLKKSGWGDIFQLSRTSNIIFWVALAGVVAVLLIVIARLLPKAPPGS